MLHSRVHKLNFQSKNAQIYIKREDELSFGVSGHKLRKYHSLIPYLIENNIHKVILIGGKNSNNILSGAQLLIENQIKPYFLLFGESGYEGYFSNFDFLKMFIKEDQIFWQSRKHYEHRDDMAQKINEEHFEGKAFILPEGAFHKEAIFGSIGLVESLIKNQEELGFHFDHIFVDAGTGFTASSLIHGLNEKKVNTKVHIIDLSGQKNEFENTYKSLKIEFNYEAESVTWQSEISKIQPSFGAVNSELLKFIRKFAQTEGVLLDPVYNGKLFYSALEKIKEEDLKGQILIIHSGGGLGVTGYLNQFRAITS